MAMRSTKRTRISADIGGTLALEFANTAGWHLSAEPSERLTSWRDFIRWAAEQSLIDAGEIAGLAAVVHPIAPVVALREAIFRVALCAARGIDPSDDDLAAIVSVAASGLPPVIWREGMLRWRVDAADPTAQLLGMIARNALDLLASDRTRRTRVCEGKGCGWLFIDIGRGQSRRWCSMNDCGNRAKARSAYQRAKLGRSLSLKGQPEAD